ncbi:MAG: restriction endonuclease subunit S [Terriglobales bacterium]
MSATWPISLLGEVFSISRGGSPRPINDYFTTDPNGVNWVLISDASENSKYIFSTKKRIRPEGVKSSRMVQPGDFLLTNSMSFGRPYIVRTSGCIHDGWLVLSPRNKNVSADFFYHLLGSDLVYSQFKRLAAGATVKNLNIELVSDVNVPVPPLTEQRRIAAILDKADELRAQRRAALAQLDNVREMIFFDLIGDPKLNPKGWPEKTIGELCEVKGGKRLPKGEEYSPTPTPFRYIRVTDLRAGSINESALVYLTPVVQAKIARYIVNTGDLIISIAGSIGLIAPVPQSLDGANLTENAAKLIPRRRNLYDAAFLAALLQTRFAQDQIGSHTGQVTIGKLALFRIEKLHLPLPPMDVQQEFARRLATVEKLKAVHRASLAKMDALFASLQHRVFRGEL